VFLSTQGKDGGGGDGDASVNYQVGNHLAPIHDSPPLSRVSSQATCPPRGICI
jgi:hypothetical protein